MQEMWRGFPGRPPGENVMDAAGTLSAEQLTEVIKEKGSPVPSVAESSTTLMNLT